LTDNCSSIEAGVSNLISLYAVIFSCVFIPISRLLYWAYQLWA